MYKEKVERVNCLVGKTLFEICKLTGNPGYRIPGKEGL